jgi:hypothetical protein
MKDLMIVVALGLAGLMLMALGLALVVAVYMAIGAGLGALVGAAVWAFRALAGV